MGMKTMHASFWTRTRIAFGRNTLALLLISMGISHIYAEESASGTGALPSYNLRIPPELIRTGEDAAMWTQLFEEILPLISEKYWREIPGEEIVARMLEGGITSIDPHSRIYSPREAEQLRESQRSSLGGIGIEINLNSNQDDDWGILVIAPLDNTPAARAGIMAGDIIVEIERETTRNMSLEEAVRLLRGNPGTAVTFRVRRHDIQELIEFRIVRESIRTSSEIGYELLEGGYGYISVSGFGKRETPNDFRNAVAAMVAENNSQPLSGLIIDLRNNPGGVLLNVSKIINQLISSERYVSNGVYNERAAQVLVTEARGELNSLLSITTEEAIVGNAPILVLTNGNTASAAEILAGGLQIHGRAIIAGTDRRTYGKGTTQSLFPLQNGGILKITVSQYVIGSAGCEQAVQGVGVEPDILLVPEVGESSQSYEEDYENAIETSTISNENCEYHFEVPMEHWEAAYEMLRILNLTQVSEEDRW